MAIGRCKRQRSRVNPDCGWRICMILGAALSALGPACASHRLSSPHAMKHGGPYVAPPDRGRSPTLGTDFFTVPRGQVIPPAGLGVDLVQGVARDPRVIPASMPARPSEASVVTGDGEGRRSRP
jgi:hypothetical protein